MSLSKFSSPFMGLFTVPLLISALIPAALAVPLSASEPSSDDITWSTINANAVPPLITPLASLTFVTTFTANGAIPPVNTTLAAPPSFTTITTNATVSSTSTTLTVTGNVTTVATKVAVPHVTGPPRDLPNIPEGLLKNKGFFDCRNKCSPMKKKGKDYFMDCVYKCLECPKGLHRCGDWRKRNGVDVPAGVKATATISTEEVEAKPTVENAVDRLLTDCQSICEDQYSSGQLVDLQQIPVCIQQCLKHPAPFHSVLRVIQTEEARSIPTEWMHDPPVGEASQTEEARSIPTKWMHDPPVEEARSVPTEAIYVPPVEEAFVHVI